eukprot:g52778.t1
MAGHNPSQSTTKNGQNYASAIKMIFNLHGRQLGTRETIPSTVEFPTEQLGKSQGIDALWRAQDSGDCILVDEI